MANSTFTFLPETLLSKKVDVSNHEFLESIFGLDPSSPRPILVSFKNSPSLASHSDWNGSAWDFTNEPKNQDWNSYFSISAFRPDEQGSYRRKKTQFAGQYVIAFDDVVTQVDADKTKAQIACDKIKLAPSWVLETSQGNYQAGYILSDPITDPTVADALSKAIIKKGLSDPGASGPTTRLMRLPFASNTKSIPAFICQMRLWEPKRRYSLKEFTQAYGIDLYEAPKVKAPMPAKAKTVHLPDSGNAVWRPIPETNIVMESLKESGLFKSVIESGKVEIRCPWTENHTDQVDSGACYWEPDKRHPIGSFKCQHAHCQDRNIRDLLSFLDIDPENAYMKHRIYVSPGNIDRIVDVVEQILASTLRFYQRGKRIVSLSTSSSGLTVKDVNSSDLTLEVSRCSRWYRYDTRSKNQVVVDPSSRHLTILLEAQNYSYLNELESISYQPIIQEDGTVTRQIGYDPKTRLYAYFPEDKYVFKERLTKEDARVALQELRTLLEEFPFKTPVDEAVALCGILTATVRAQLPYAPLFLINAHLPGTGKTTLAQTLSLFATDKSASSVPFPKENAEFEKLLLAELLKAPPVIHFDNLTTDVYPHKCLCSAITATSLTGRILGESKTAEVGTRVLLIANGNNVQAVGDMTRRTITIDLDTEEEIPATREFKHPNLLEDIRTQREHYVNLALNIILAWIQAGKPKTACQKLNSFDLWNDWCRQPLMWLGLPDPVSKVFQAIKEDPERTSIGNVLKRLHEEFGLASFSVRTIKDRFRKTSFSERLSEVFEEMNCLDRDGLNSKRLGWWLKHKTGWSVDGFKLVRSGMDAHSKQTLYQIQVTKKESDHGK